MKKKVNKIIIVGAGNEGALARKILEEHGEHVEIVFKTPTEEEIKESLSEKKDPFMLKDELIITNPPQYNDAVIVSDDFNKKSGKHFGKRHRHKNKFNY